MLCQYIGAYSHLQSHIDRPTVIDLAAAGLNGRTATILPVGLEPAMNHGDFINIGSSSTTYQSISAACRINYCIFAYLIDVLLAHPMLL